MAQKSGLNFKKILEYIGVVEVNDNEDADRKGARYDDDAYDEVRYTPPRNSRSREAYAQKRTRSEESNYNVYFGARSEPERPRAKAAGPAKVRPAQAPRPQTARRASDHQMVRPENSMQTSNSTMVYYLHSLSECGDVIQDLIRGNSVFMNLEETDSAQMQRIVDTLAGATFALNAKIRKVAEKTYLIAPKNVNVNMTRSVERRY